ncbi:hypothetical protein HNQ07_000151 [Deinococcus metalli]|uniref:Uncharacterized protein n=1 Tax=Deinococcus metalli TaxID=1141878 RepID=A0A7W8NQ23_9DEIO|nr:hypothetical protein [Deinococcus metalli]MBB5374707.1 hypothetical protein [Deinococcus metalli]GHF34308.1 hypothetical protein GCM10017781_08920 [Deinococcus metalli]
MKRSLTVLLTGLALLGGMTDAARRSGGSFGGSRSVPRVTVPRVNTAPRPVPSVPSRSPATSQRSAALPSAAAVRSSPANRAAASTVTPTQLSAWRSAPLPAGVPRTALTYSATRSSAYPYQLQSGRYYPYPQDYYRRRGIGADLFRYAVIFLAVDAIADAATPNRVIPSGTGDLSDVPATTGSAVAQAPSGPNVWAYAGTGLLAAGAAWFVFGRRRGSARR